ncbi:hypothetical protein [Bacillus suaedaesalsae]|uniref:Uncharacterized protein n=1 Tax=Bacillus suaedaesalsae TaxID=2810349 RepID=A0ABS2DI66_9BACI|nr:hypothetical protein [Bacillus suaedaesalsae]MBM6618175.1 hypothetical protein [Bacillus suaedaesalsae]
MLLLQWGYTKKYNIKAIFDYCPNSTVIFRQIQDYYFVYIVNWSEPDPIIDRDNLVLMEQLLNKELGTLEAYEKRKSNQSNVLT